VNRPVGPPDAQSPAVGALGALDAGELAADLVAVAVFVALGRASHHEGGVVLGFLGTRWPFAVGAVVGSGATVLVARRGDRPLPASSLRAGGIVLAATVVVGMTLRRLCTDGGTPVSFLLVATTFLAVLLLGRRLVAGWWAGRRAAPAAGSPAR